MFYLYNILVVIIVVLLVLPYYLRRLCKEKAFGRRFRQSFGFFYLDEISVVINKKCIWLHAASVGEIVATSPIAQEIKVNFPNTPLLISVVTSTGYEMAKRIISDADAIIYFPIDIPWISYRIQKLIQPKVVILVETELWPNFLKYCKILSIPVMLVNGRISEKSAKNYRYLFSILHNMFDSVQYFCMQSIVDAQHIIKLGANPRKVIVTGNTKFDQTYTKVSKSEKNVIYKTFFMNKKKLLIIAGSTHKGEEELMLKAFKNIKKRFPKVRLILAPRDISRAEEVCLLTKEYNFSVTKRTILKMRKIEPTDVVVLDTIGELGKIYGIGDIIFIGGSLIKKGGHNLLEPAAHGKPIIVGPHMFNFKNIYALLVACGACKTVFDEESLAFSIIEILKNNILKQQMSNNSSSIILANRGAAKKSIYFLKQLLIKK